MALPETYQELLRQAQDAVERLPQHDLNWASGPPLMLATVTGRVRNSECNRCPGEDR